MIPGTSLLVRVMIPVAIRSFDGLSGNFVCLPENTSRKYLGFHRQTWLSFSTCTTESLRQRDETTGKDR